MRFNTFGSKDKPVVVMLAGSFCPGESMKYLYDIWKKEFYIIVPDYNGHYEGSTFSTRQNEAHEKVEYIREQGIPRIKMVYGQSMGAIKHLCIINSNL